MLPGRLLGRRLPPRRLEPISQTGLKGAAALSDKPKKSRPSRSIEELHKRRRGTTETFPAHTPSAEHRRVEDIESRRSRRAWRGYRSPEAKPEKPPASPQTVAHRIRETEERSRRSDFLTALALGAAGFLAVIISYSGIGWSWDEAYYLPPAELARDWIGAGMPGSPEALETYWREINELPSVCKFIWASGLVLFEPLMGPMPAMRLTTAFVFAGTLMLLFYFLRFDLGRGGAALASVSLFAFPRVFGHTHIAATETTTMLVILATTLAFRQGIGSTRWAVATGVLFGVAMATKINCFFLFPALLLWGYIYHPRQVAAPTVSMVFIGPIVFVALWPWLWHETAPRILEYLLFHAGHQDTAVYYFGKKWGYGAPNAPWHYPFVMLVITTPIVLLVGLILGMARAAVRIRRPISGLLLIQALLPLFIIAMPGQPKYDGVRLFLPAYPFLAGLVALGYDGLIRALTRREYAGGGIMLREPLLVGTMILIVGSALLVHWRTHPLYLSYYNRIVGGLKGAYEKGFEVTYWGDRLTDEVLEWMSDTGNVPLHSAVKTRALFPRILEQRQRFGHLREDILFDELPDGRDTYDFHLVQVRRGFWTEFDWTLFEQAPRARAIFGHEGVPMIIVYGPLKEYFGGPEQPERPEREPSPTPHEEPAAAP